VKPIGKFGLFLFLSKTLSDSQCVVPRDIGRCRNNAGSHQGKAMMEMSAKRIRMWIVLFLILLLNIGSGMLAAQGSSLPVGAGPGDFVAEEG